MQHLSIVDAFDRAFLMSGLDIAYSEGFNPMPRFETAQPLPIAVESSSEIASLILRAAVDARAFIDSINGRLPAGLRIEEAAYFPIQEGKKQRTIGSLEWGSEYRIRASNPEAASALAAAIQGVIDSRSIPDATVRVPPDDGSVSLRIRLPKNKDHGLVRILEACTDKRPIQGAFGITRSALYAEAGEGAPVTFFEAYSIVS